MEIIQIFVIVFALFALSRAILRIKDKEITLKEFLLWSFIWIATIVVTILPQTAIYVSKFFGVGRAVDLIVYAGMIVMFYLLFRLYVKTEKMEHAVSILTREAAILRKEIE